MSKERKKCCNNNGCNNSLSLEGNSGDLFTNDGVFQEITVIGPLTCTEDSCIGMSLYSIDRSGKHELLNKFLNKKVKFTISILE